MQFYDSGAKAKFLARGMTAKNIETLKTIHTEKQKESEIVFNVLIEKFRTILL